MSVTQLPTLPPGGGVGVRQSPLSLTTFRFPLIELQIMSQPKLILFATITFVLTQLYYFNERIRYIQHMAITNSLSILLVNKHIQPLLMGSIYILIIVKTPRVL